MTHVFCSLRRGLVLGPLMDDIWVRCLLIIGPVRTGCWLVLVDVDDLGRMGLLRCEWF